MESLVKIHKKEYGEEPDIIIDVPGVVILGGIFSQYCDGLSLSTTGDSCLRIMVSKRDDQNFRLYNNYSCDHKKFSSSSLKYRKEDRWANYFKGVVYALLSEVEQVPGMNISLDGELLKADNSVFSVSASIGFCFLMNRIMNLDMDANSLVRIAYHANTSFCGEDCRISDFVTLLKCKENEILSFDLHSAEYSGINFPFPLDGYRACLLDSNIRPGAMREELAVRKSETREAFTMLRKFKPFGLLRDFPESDLSARVVPLDEDSRHICSYVLSESKAAGDMSQAISDRDVVLYGRILNKIQSGLRDEMEITCPEVDWLTKRAVETPGCAGAGILNNGYHGNILLLIKDESMAEYDEKLEIYKHIFGFMPSYRDLQIGGSIRVVRE